MGFLAGTETLHFSRRIGVKKRGTWGVMTGSKVRFLTDTRTAQFEDRGCPVEASQTAIATAAADRLDEAAGLTKEVRSLGKDTPARKRAEAAQLKAFEAAASCVLQINDRMLRDEFLKPALAFLWPPRINDVPLTSFEVKNLVRMRSQLRAYAATMGSLEEHTVVGRLQKATRATTVALAGLAALYVFLTLRRRAA
jgi:hypothetical protein